MKPCNFSPIPDAKERGIPSKCCLVFPLFPVKQAKKTHRNSTRISTFPSKSISIADFHILIFLWLSPCWNTISSLVIPYGTWKNMDFLHPVLTLWHAMAAMRVMIQLQKKHDVFQPHGQFSGSIGTIFLTHTRHTPVWGLSIPIPWLVWKGTYISESVSPKFDCILKKTHSTNLPNKPSCMRGCPESGHCIS